LLELEGEAPRVLRAGDAFWEPGGDVIHYQDANNRTDIRTGLSTRIGRFAHARCRCNAMSMQREKGGKASCE
jgi:hypothetical protein